MASRIHLKAAESSVLGVYINHLESVAERLLTAQEEGELAQAVANGDSEARNILVQFNAKLVIHIASQYVGRGLDLEDLVGEGNLGLIRAAKEFKPEFGTRFSTYAAYWIKQSIRLALTNTAAVIRLPSHMVVLLQQWSKTKRELESDLAREAEFDEIANQMELSQTLRSHVRKAMIARSLAIESNMTSDDRTDHPTDHAHLILEGPESRLVLEEEQLWLNRRLTRLNDRERVVIALRYGLHGGESLTWVEIGERLGVTREWARKIELKALEKLRSDANPNKKTASHKKATHPIITKPPGGSALTTPSSKPRSPLQGALLANVVMAGV